MPGYSALLPFQKDPNDGFALLQTIREVASQNIKMVLFTEPGERVFDPAFGVGLKKYLFESSTGAQTKIQLRNTISEQISRYLPYISIIDISFESNLQNSNNDSLEEKMNKLNISIKYQISNFSEVEVLEL
jgi:phage baseplate assembly protein W